MLSGVWIVKPFHAVIVSETTPFVGFVKIEKTKLIVVEFSFSSASRLHEELIWSTGYQNGDHSVGYFTSELIKLEYVKVNVCFKTNVCYWKIHQLIWPIIYYFRVTLSSLKPGSTHISIYGRVSAGGTHVRMK